MKITKKLLTILLVFALAFSIVACGDPEPCSEHIDENNDGVCDREDCGALIPGKAVGNAVATSYVDAVFQAIESAKTIVFTAEIDTTVTKTDFKDKNGNIMPPVGREQTIKIGGIAEFTLSYNEEKVDLKCQLDLSVDNSGEVEEISEAVYFIDGILYTKAVNDVWYGERITAEMLLSTLPEEALAILSSMDFDAFITAPTEEKIAEVKGAINEALSGLFKVNEDGSIGIVFDMASKINPYLTAIQAIDGEDTIADILNPYLMSMGITSTLEELIDVITLSGSKTAGELYSALNVYLTQNTGKNLQGMYDEIMAIPEIEIALISAGVCDKAGFDEIKALKLDTVMAQYSALTVDELMVALFGEGATVAQLGAMVKAVVTMPLSEFEDFETLEAIADLASCDAAYSYFNIALDEGKNFSGMSAGIEFSFKTVCEIERDSSSEYYSLLLVDFGFEINITSISATETTIELPEGVVIPPV